MHLQVAQRTPSVVRFGMISLAVIGVSMLLLLLTTGEKLREHPVYHLLP